MSPLAQIGLVSTLDAEKLHPAAVDIDNSNPRDLAILPTMTIGEGVHRHRATGIYIRYYAAALVARYQAGF